MLIKRICAWVPIVFETILNSAEIIRLCHQHHQFESIQRQIETIDFISIEIQPRFKCYSLSPESELSTPTSSHATFFAAIVVYVTMTVYVCLYSCWIWQRHFSSLPQFTFIFEFNHTPIWIHRSSSHCIQLNKISQTSLHCLVFNKENWFSTCNWHSVPQFDYTRFQLNQK